jgi:hypothetical protein
VLWVRNERGVRAAIAEVGAPDATAASIAASIDLGRWPRTPLPAKADRPPASEEAFAARPVLGSVEARFHLDVSGRYLESIGETLSLYVREGVAHPGWLLAQANDVLAANVVLGPWIHVESQVRNLGLVHDGDIVSTRAVVLGTSERKGHRFVELDVLVLDGAERPVMRARHVAIYQPRSPDDATPVAGDPGAQGTRPESQPSSETIRRPIDGS